MRLTANHAQVIGGVMVEPGGEFDESKLDPAELERLQTEGKARSVSATPKRKKGDG